MNTEELYNNLKALQNKAFNLSKTDKKFIREVSEEFKIEFVPRSKCEDCYRDQIIILLIELKKKLSAEQNTSCAYEMINDKFIKWQGIKINNETITNEIAEKFISSVSCWDKFIKLKE